MKKASTKDTKKAATTRGGSGGAGGGNNNTSATGGAATITTTNNPNVNVSGGPGAGGLLYELPEQNIVIWPEWSDAEVMAEKWTTKHIFEDGEGAILLPRSLRPMFEGYKRPVELSTDIPVGLTSPANLESLFSTQQTVGGGGGGGLSLTGSTLQGAVNESKDPVVTASDGSTTSDTSLTNNPTSENSSSDPSNPSNTASSDDNNSNATSQQQAAGGQQDANSTAAPNAPSSTGLAPTMATSSSDGGNNGNASNAAGGISGTGQNMSSSISATSPSTTTDNNSALPDGANNTGGASSALSSSNGGGENGDNNSSPNGPTPDGADDSTAQPSSVPDGATSTANGGDGSASQSEGPNEQISEQEYFAGTSKFIQVNKHLLGSDLMRSILATLHFLYEQSKLQKANPSPPPGAGAVPGATIAVGGAANAINTAATAAATANPAAAPSPSDEFVPWDHIYPKGKDGLPLYNISGKYIVKLYWMGQWRKITVDDKIPVDANGRPLLISSPFAHEVWPLILCKALVKVASTSYKEHDGISEQGDFDVLNTLRGWLPERFVLNAHKPSASLWNSLCQLNLKNLNPGAAAAASAAANSAGGISNLNASIGNTLTVAGGGAGGGNAASVLFANATSAAAGDAASAGGSGAGGVATAGSGATMTATYNSAAAPGATPSSQIMAKRGNLPSSRGGETLSNLSQTGPYVVALAYRDGDDVVEKIDFSSIPIYFRVVDIREGAITQSVSQQQPPPPGTQSKEWDSNSTVQRLVKLRTYFSGGVVRQKRAAENRTVKAIETLDGNGGTSSIDDSEYWMLYSDFCKTFRHINIYHNPSGFKFVKQLQTIVDPAKLSENIRILPVLYSLDPTKDTNIMISLHTYGRYNSSTLVQGTSAVVEKWEWKNGVELASAASSTQRQAARTPVLRISSNYCLTSFFNMESGRHAYRFAIDCPTAFQVTVWSREEFALEDESKYLTEKLGLQVKDVDEVFPAQPAGGSWFVLFKHVFHVPQPTCMFAALYTLESVQTFVCLRMFDNDGPHQGTTIEVPQVFYQLRPQLCAPNKNGYTLLADCKLPVAKPATKWKLRIATEPPMPAFSLERPLEGMSIKPIIQDFDDMYIPNKHNILFRYLIKVKDAPENQVSMQLQFTLPFVALTLQLFDHDNEVVSAKGKGLVSIHAVSISANQPEGDGATVPPTKAGGGKEARMAEKINAQVVPLSAPKHKYILQGSIEPIELSKFMSSLGTGATEANRPISRGINKTGSGKKKRSVAGNGGAAAAGTAASGGAGGASGGTGATTGESQAGTGNMGLTTTDPYWKLRLISTDTTSLIVTKDTEKEDRYKALKDSWEQQQPGRATKAREARDAYTKQVEQGVIRPTAFTIHSTKDSCKPWTILNHGNSNTAASTNNTKVSTPAAANNNNNNKPVNETLSPLSQASISSKRSSAYLVPVEKKDEKDDENLPEETVNRSQSTVHHGIIVNWPPATGPRILTKEEVAERDDVRLKTYNQSLSSQEKIRQDRVKDKEKRVAVRQHQVAVMDEKIKEMEVYQKEDIARREGYKLFVLKQIEDAMAKKAQIALAAAGLANAEGVAANDDAGAEKKKKGAGVKAR